jgi:hypothetical protein
VFLSISFIRQFSQTLLSFVVVIAIEGIGRAGGDWRVLPAMGHGLVGFWPARVLGLGGGRPAKVPGLGQGMPAMVAGTGRSLGVPVAVRDARAYTRQGALSFDCQAT